MYGDLLMQCRSPTTFIGSFRKVRSIQMSNGSFKPPALFDAAFRLSDTAVLDLQLIKASLPYLTMLPNQALQRTPRSWHVGSLRSRPAISESSLSLSR